MFSAKSHARHRIDADAKTYVTLISLECTANVSNEVIGVFALSDYGSCFLSQFLVVHATKIIILNNTFGTAAGTLEKHCCQKLS